MAAANTVYIKESNKESGEENTSWSELPLELVSRISSLVFEHNPCAIGMIRSICKHWRLVNTISRCSRPSFIDHQYPYLVSQSSKDCTLYHPVYNNTFHLEIPELSDASIECSKFGWLLLSRQNPNPLKGCSLVFLNPFTRETKTITPCLPFYCCWYNLCFSASPSSFTCYIVAISSMLFILKLGDPCWKVHKIPPEYKSCCSNNYCEHWRGCHPVINKKRCYFLAPNGRLLVFDFETTKLSLIDKHFPRKEVAALANWFLVDANGELFAVLVFKGERDVCVRRMIFQKKKSSKNEDWPRVDNLCNKMIYISSKSSPFMASAPVAGTNNKIYFPKMQENECIFFSLATQKYHSFSGSFMSECPYTPKEHKKRHWFWIHAPEF